MSQVMVVPEMIAAAATDVAAMGSSLDAAHLVAAAPTVAVLPAAADEVSGAVANLFSQHAQTYQTLAGQAAAFNNQFVQHLNASMHAYTSAEAANAVSLAAPAASTQSGLQDQALTVVTDWLTSTIAHVEANAVALINNTITVANNLLDLFFSAANVAFGYFFVGYLLLGYSILGVQAQIYKLFGILPPNSWPLVGLKFVGR